jgi:hypothetical protein
MTDRPIQIYVGTSVFGGVYDDEFAVQSQKFFKEVQSGRFMVLISQVTLDELSDAPKRVQEVLESIDPKMVREVPVDEVAFSLAQAYIKHEAVTEKWLDDALHVAVATLAGAELILSWNFKHIVNFDRIRKFNGVNLLLGYRQVDIRSPLDVVNEE